MFSTHPRQHNAKSSNDDRVANESYYRVLSRHVVNTMMAKLTKLKPSAGSCVANDDRVPTMAKLTKLKPSAGSPTMAKLTKLN